MLSLAQESAKQSAAIMKLTESQANSARSVESKMQRISESAMNSLQTAEENVQISQAISDQVYKMRSITKID